MELALFVFNLVHSFYFHLDFQLYSFLEQSLVSALKIHLHEKQDPCIIGCRHGVVECLFV
mgnify:CR=1 FL=1